MNIGMIGLGKMGLKMAERLLLGGHTIIGTAHSKESVLEAEQVGISGAFSIQELVKKIPSPKIVWVMVPAGQATDEVLGQLATLLSKGDIVVDGGNSYYKDTLRHNDLMIKQGIRFLDCGTSGGIWGLKEGYSLMIGGDPETVEVLRPVFETLAPAKDQGWGRVGPVGAGHFTKMVHNGIEYGMMQSFAEGFEILAAKKEFELDLHQVSQIWQKGSVVRSWLLDLAERVFAADPSLGDIQAYIADSGEGRWTVNEAMDLEVSAPVITASLLRRIRSRQSAPYSDKLVAALRNQFGGHSMKMKRQD